MFRIILTNEVIELDNNLSVDERIRVCEEIIAAHPEEFEYSIPTGKPKPIELDYSEKVKSRLNIMGEYIYQASPNSTTHPTITRYKEKRNRKREVVMEIKD